MSRGAGYTSLQDASAQGFSAEARRRQVKVRIVSIDAWRQPDGWTWNMQHNMLNGLRDASEIPEGTRPLLRWLRAEGFLTPYSVGTVRVDTYGGDPEVIEIQDRHTGEPLIAIVFEYTEGED